MTTIKAIAFAAALAAPHFANAQGQPSAEPFDLSKLSCWEVMSLSEDDSSFVIGLMIGYLQGSAGDPSLSPATIIAKVEGLDTKCIETPDEPALTVLQSVE